MSDIESLMQLKAKINQFNIAYQNLVCACQMITDINDYVVDDYTFSVSFDEIGIPQWCETCNELINEEIHSKGFETLEDRLLRAAEEQLNNNNFDLSSKHKNRF